jgi:hypothetical protein
MIKILLKVTKLFPSSKQPIAGATKCVEKTSLAQKLVRTLHFDIPETKRLLSRFPLVFGKVG